MWPWTGRQAGRRCTTRRIGARLQARWQNGFWSPEPLKEHVENRFPAARADAHQNAPTQLLSRKTARQFPTGETHALIIVGPVGDSLAQ
jgi:hypothetical protein